MPSLWLADRVESASPPALDDGEVAADVIVVGAGITGMTTAVLLARAGKRVVVLEARHVGAGTTGNTTGKVSLLQGTKLSRIAARHGQDVVQGYVTGNLEGRDWLLRHCEDHGLDAQREDAFSYAQSASGVADARAELNACREAGLPADWASDADVPFPFAGGVRLREQAQIDPMPFLQSLVVEFETHGGRLIEGVRVRSVSGNGPVRLEVSPDDADSPDHNRVSMTAQQCVLATGIPILDRGVFFARLQPSRSYCLAFDVPGDVTRSMFLSVDSPTRSVRYAPRADGDKLVVGGGGHTVGRADSPAKSVDQLRRWAELHYPGAVETHYWSAQDYSPVDELPYVGPLTPGNETLFVATGFDKWGMSNGVASGLALSSRILGGRMDWAQAFSSWHARELAGLGTAVKANLEVGFHLAKGWVSPITNHSSPTEGTGVVTGPPWNLRADCVVDGVHHRTSPVCPHLGGIVSWNDADQAWECPLHGSRFSPDGSLIEGPATHGLSNSG